MARAVQIVRHGEPEGLVLAEVQAPPPGLDEITIDVHAARASISPISWWCAVPTRILAPLPFSPGKEVAGIVSAVGERVTEFRVGDRVLAYVENGGYVDQITLRTFLCHPMPDGLDAADAIGIGLTFQTAHFALFARGQMKSGEIVLVTGATGGVGIATVQLAKACGAIVVAGCMTASKAGFARENGADHVVMLDRPDLDQSSQGGDRGADRRPRRGRRGRQSRRSRIRRLSALARLVRPHRRGRFRCRSSVDVAFQLSADQEHRRRRAALERLSRPHAGHVRSAQQEIFALWRQGRLTSPVTEALRLDEAALALRRIADRQVRGKIVLLTERYTGRLVPSPDTVRS